MIYGVSLCDVFYLIIGNDFYGIVRFVDCGCGCMEYIDFVFWCSEVFCLYVIVVFNIGFNLIVDECFVFGNCVD